MSDEIKIKRIEKGITDRLQGMLDRNRSIRTFLVRNIYPMYRNVQAKRWKSEGKSEGSAWKRLDADYSKRKLTQFAEYPGQGTKMLVAKYNLYPSVVGPGNGFRMVVDETKMRLFTAVDYAPYVNEIRPFDTYSAKTRKRFRSALKDYITSNKITLMNEDL
jgi:hypothetical protein